MTKSTLFNNKLKALKGSFDKQSLVFRRGLERESLRVDASGNLSMIPHPDFLGSKLSHPTITTDFSEAQPELITPVSSSIPETLKSMNDIHRYVYSGLEDEVLWSASMPCVLSGDADIPIAQYGSSNLGKLKTTYRNGLGNRYGRSMQTICAIHYNFSFSNEFWQKLAHSEGADNSSTYRTKRYFDVMRNFRRFSWLAIFLTGASPAVCNSFVKGRAHNLEKFDKGSLYQPEATSLRNGNLGYQSDAQSELIDICYNSLENYVERIARAVVTTYPPYTKIGTSKNGEYLQVNDCVLQSEAEFYTTIRAKRVPRSGVNFLKSLLDEGVEYVEVRLLDIDPYQPIGINETTIHFLDTLLLYCLLVESPKHDDALCESVANNVTEVVHRGRNVNTLINDQGKQRTIAEWGNEILNDLLSLADQLDEIMGTGSHRSSIQSQQQKLADPDLTPSGVILKDMHSESVPFFRFAMNKAIEHKQHFMDQPLSKGELEYFERLVATSKENQEHVEQQASISFDAYLKNIKQQYLDLLG